MPPQSIETQHNYALALALFVVGLVVGGAGGFWAAQVQADLLTSAQPVPQQQNTYDTNTEATATGSAEANPLEGVKTNPFE